MNIFVNQMVGRSQSKGFELVGAHILPSQRSVDDLEIEIIGLSQRINMAEFEFLAAVREFDVQRGWESYHLNSCAEWLNLNCGITVATAREKVRTAHAVAELPLMSDALRSGRLSYSNVRALTRVATKENEQHLVEYAAARPATQVEQHCRQLRHVQRAESLFDANELHENRFLSYSVLPDGGVTISLELPSEDGELVMRAIEHAAAQAEQEATNVSAIKQDTLQQRQADALVRMAREYFSGSSSSGSSSSADHYQVVVHVDESALVADESDGKEIKKASGRSRSDLPIETVRRLTCDASLVSVLEDSDGNPLNVGRKKRVVSTAIRRALFARDEQCRYPGCSHKKWLDAHHVTHWIDGGETSVDNLMLLCSKHHRLLHEGGFEFVSSVEGGFGVRTQDGRVLKILSERNARTESAYVHS